MDPTDRQLKCGLFKRYIFINKPAREIEYNKSRFFAVSCNQCMSYNNFYLLNKNITENHIGYSSCIGPEILVPDAFSSVPVTESASR